MDDLVWTAIQDSPVISKGQINLQIQEINKSDAKWQYLPEMHLNYHITTNLTKKNEGSRYVGESYGETTYETTFQGFYRNPVSTYFNVEAQNELMKTAIASQRKVIADCIYQIANTLLNIYKNEKSIDIIEAKIAEAQKRSDYAAINEKRSVEWAGEASLADDLLESMELRLQEIKMNLMMNRTALKKLIGLDINLALKVDAKSVFPLLGSFHPERMDWEQAWKNSEDKYLADQSVKLETANIYIAWAQYFPNINIGVNESPGKGQSQPTNAESDQFLHMSFIFPLLDWGHRWRQADIASERRKQRRLEVIEKTRNYQQDWESQQQKNLLAEATVARWQQSLKSLAKRREGTEISFRNGGASLGSLTDMRQRELDAELSLLNAETGAAQAKLDWMAFASALSRHYLGEAGFGDK